MRAGGAGASPQGQSVSTARESGSPRSLCSIDPVPTKANPHQLRGPSLSNAIQSRMASFRIVTSCVRTCQAPATVSRHRVASGVDATPWTCLALHLREYRSIRVTTQIIRGLPSAPARRLVNVPSLAARDVRSDPPMPVPAEEISHRRKNLDQPVRPIGDNKVTSGSIAMLCGKWNSPGRAPGAPQEGNEFSVHG